MPARIVEDVFLLCIFWDSLSKNQVFKVCAFVRIFYSVPLIHMSVCMLIQRCLNYYSSTVELDVRKGDTSRRPFIVQDCFGYPGFFVFPYEAEYCVFEFCEKLHWDFDGCCIESVDCF